MSKKEPLEVIEQIELTKLHPFPDHPFGVRDDDSMQQTVESIREYGVLVPAIARPREDGGYELIAGHRRKHACELAGLKTMPVIVRDIDRNVATIIMVDSNLQRENILPSERAKAYKMKLDAIKRQGARHDLTSDQVGQKFSGKTSRELIAENSPDSATQIQRYISPRSTPSLSAEKSGVIIFFIFAPASRSFFLSFFFMLSSVVMNTILTGFRVYPNGSRIQHSPLLKAAIT